MKYGHCSDHFSGLSENNTSKEEVNKPLERIDIGLVQSPYYILIVLPKTKSRSKQNENLHVMHGGVN